MSPGLVWWLSAGWDIGMDEVYRRRGEYCGMLLRTVIPE
jgi:hypothetical protein